MRLFARQMALMTIMSTSFCCFAVSPEEVLNSSKTKACETLLSDEVETEALSALIRTARTTPGSIFSASPASLVELFPVNGSVLPKYYEKAIQFLYKKDKHLLSIRNILSQYRSYADFSARNRPWLRVRIFALAVKSGLDYDYQDSDLSGYELRFMQQAFLEADITNTIFYFSSLWGGDVPEYVMVAKTGPGAVRSRIRPDGPLGSFWKGQAVALFQPRSVRERRILVRASDVDAQLSTQTELAKYFKEFVGSAVVAPSPQGATPGKSFPRTGVLIGAVDVHTLPERPNSIAKENIHLLEDSLRQGNYEGDSYLAANESYTQLIQQDEAQLNDLGTTAKKQAEWLRGLLTEIQRREDAEDEGILNYSGQEYVVRRLGPGGSRSHYGDDFSWGAFYQVVNLHTGRSAWFSKGHIYMIGFYGFYGGGSNRLSPKAIESLR